MCYLLIPLTDTALSVGEVAPEIEAGSLSDGQLAGLARDLERTIQMCELLVTYAVAVAGKPSRH